MLARPLVVAAARRCSLIVLLVALWWAAALRMPAFVLPGPERVAEALATLLRSGSFFDDLGATLYRVLAGFALGAVLGAPLGVALGASPRAARFFEPLLFTRITLTELIATVLKVYLFAMLLYWIATFVSPGGYAPGIRLLAQLCEPILRRVRRVIPPIGQIDFSFLWVSIAIGALLILLR